MKLTTSFLKQAGWIKQAQGFLISAGLAVAVAVFFLLGAFERLELISLDFRYRLNKQTRVSDSLVLVGITQGDQTILGQSPTREHYGQLISILSEAGTAVIVFDVFFPDYRNSAEDHLLAEAAAKAGNVILPVFSPEQLVSRKAAMRGPVYRASRLQSSYAELEKNAAGLGHINVVADQDQVVRALPAYISYRDRIYPQIGLEAIRLYEKTRPPKDNRPYRLHIDRLGRYYLNYTQPGRLTDSAHAIAFSRALQGDFPAGFFRNKIVLVGQTIQGLKNADLAPTPFGYTFGALIELNALNSFLTRQFMQRLPAGVTILLMAGLVLILGFAVFTPKNKINLAAAVVLVCGILAGSLILFQKTGLILETVPLSALTISAWAGSLIFSLREAVKKEKFSLTMLRQEEEEMAALINPFLVTDSPGQPLLKSGDDLRMTQNTPGIAIRILANSIGAFSAVLFIHQQDKNLFLPLSTFGITPQNEKDLIKIAQKTSRDKKPWLCKNPAAVSDPALPDLSRQINNFMALPIISQNQVCAVVIFLNKQPTAFSPTPFFTQNDIQLSTIMSLQTIATVQNANLSSALRDAHLDTIIRLAKAVEYRDLETGDHINRIRDYVTIIACGLNLPDIEADLIRNAVPMHDIGKIAIPDSVLLKPGPLTPEERIVMQTHTTIGARILAGSSSAILQASEIVALHHHERYDGTGYPHRLKGNDIPLYGRISAIADVFDAVCSKRCYKKAQSVDTALAIIREGSGKAFDPDMVEIFLSNLKSV